MIKGLKAFLRSGAPAESGQKHSHDELHVAAAALMIEAATMDDQFDGAERQKISDLVRNRFELSGEEAAEILALAEAKVEDSVQVYGFTRVLKDAFEHEERVEMMEMLWQVVYADGELHDMEASLMRRVAGLLFVSDRESGDARKRALRRLQS